MELQLEEGIRKRYSKEEKEKHIMLWKSSGLSRAEYSRQNKIPPTKFYTWCRKQNKRDYKKSFVEVKLSSAAIGGNSQIEIVMANGITIRMREEISPNVIMGIIEKIREI